MGCVLRIGGTDFDPDEFLDKTGLTPCAVYYKGDTTSSGYCWEDSTIHVVSSDTDFWEHKQQLEGALAFLSEYESGLRLIKDFPGIEYAIFDFGVAGKEEWWMWHLTFPVQLLKQLVDMEIELRVSIYPRVEDDSEVSEKQE